MANSFSEQLEELLNPKPRLTDPEDDEEEATRARVIERLTQEEEGEEDGGLSVLRKNNTSLLSDTDPRYRGRKVTRRDLLQEKDEEEEEEEESSIEVIEEGGEDSLGDDDDDEEEEEEAFITKGAEVTSPQGVDYHKLTEGMDDLGVSEEEETEGSDEDDDDEMEDDNDEGNDSENGEETVRTFSQEKVDEEVERGKAVKHQLALWDQLLEGRIKLQKVLVTANQLPQPPTFNEFRRRGGAVLGAELKNSHKALKALQRSLLELHALLLDQNPDTRTITRTNPQDKDEEVDSDEDEEAPEGGAPKRKLEMAEYPDFMAKRFAAFQPYRNATLQKWHDKTRLALGRSSRGFGAFDRNILTQVEQVLMDRERLVRRTQTRRSEYRVLGKKEVSVPIESVHLEGQDTDQQLKANTHLKDLDEDIFDDDDFYHQLLRELIERKTSAADPNDQVAMGRQWLAIQKLRSKIKKKVDTKASKGRKVRFHVHSKLVNFMAPMDHSSVSDEARSELYRGLFGQNAAIRN